MDNRIQNLWNNLHSWADKTFGTVEVRGSLPPLFHLKKEVQELIENPNDKYEYADALHLLFDAARRAGISLEGLIEAAEQKLEINKERKWGKPDENGVILHI